MNKTHEISLIHYGIEVKKMKKESRMKRKHSFIDCLINGSRSQFLIIEIRKRILC